MSIKKILQFCLFLLLCGFEQGIASPDSVAHKRPGAVLIMLTTERNRVRAFTRSGNHKALEKIEQDLTGIKTATMADFNDHFTYCPVYYFVDTNLGAVMDGKFNVLLDSSGNPARDVHISDTNFFIIFYGYASSQSRQPGTSADPDFQYSSGEPSIKGLIINNYKFQQISFYHTSSLNKSRDIIYGAFDKKYTDPQAKYGKYAYISKNYDLEYLPFALKLSLQLEKAPDKLHIRNTPPSIDTLGK